MDSMVFTSLSTHRPHLAAITIPGNGTATGATLASLIGNIGRPITQVIIPGNQPAVTTDRAAFLIASPRPGKDIAAADFTSHGLLVESGIALEIGAQQVQSLSVRSSDASAVPALVIVL